VRRWALTDTSGDPALDAAAGQALAQFRFAAPTLGCVTMSTVIPWSWAFRPDSVPSGAPASGQPAPTASPVVCGAPFVAVTRLGLPPRRETPGTATVDVSLSADARVTAVHLATSSGIKKTDYAATIAARRAAYEFVPVNGCRPVATVYRLELTFR
jgi:TonB family protein